MHLTKENIYDFVKTKTDKKYNVKVSDTKYYIKVFFDYQNKDIFSKWNWACFSSSFLGLEYAWFFYRKMYIRGTLIFLVFRFLCYFLIIGSYNLFTKEIFFSLTNVKSLFLLSIMAFINITWAIFLGAYGNALYLNFIKKKKSKGFKSLGTNFPAMLIGFILWFLLPISMEVIQTYMGK